MATTTRNPSINPEDVLTVILGGGQGTRLFPLTQARAKPAVPLAGKYRLVDIPISNCINSKLHRVYLLTQFNSASLHRHIAQAYKFDHFTHGFIDILAAEQRPTDSSWYQGTADAVRKSLVHLQNQAFEYLLVLSGDQLYRMDFRSFLAQHVESDADVTVGVVAVPRSAVGGFGIMQMDDQHRLIRFVEKPTDPAVQDSLRLSQEWYPHLGIEDPRELFLASMGIYVFGRRVLLELLAKGQADFGKHIIQAAIHSHRVYGYVFQGYWEDIGTIRAFFDANLELLAPEPRFSFYDMTAPIYTRPRFLPPSRVARGILEGSLVAEGCLLERTTIRQSLLGVRSVVGSGSQLHRTVMMGADYYESEVPTPVDAAKSWPPLGVGRNTRIENTIIDKNARIGSGCVLTPAGKPDTVDHSLYFIRDGILVIPKNGVVPDDTII